MEYRTIADTDIRISTIGFGCWTMGGLNWINGRANGWADPDQKAITEGIAAGLEAGVNHFDNADAYGNGRAERMLAACLNELKVDSASVVIASKVGHMPGSAAHAYEHGHIVSQCEQSLRNLKRDFLDIYYFHHGDFGANDRYLAEAIDAMHKLKEQGKIKAIGLSAYSESDFVRLVPRIQPKVLQTWAHCLNNRFIAPESPLEALCQRNELSMVAFSPLAQGRLLGKYSAQTPPHFEDGDNRKGKSGFSAEALADLEPILEKVKERFGDTTQDLAAAALGYVLGHDHVAGVIPGFRNKSQALCNVSAANSPISSEDVAWLRKLFEPLNGVNPER